MWDWLSLIKCLLRPLLQQQTHMFTEVQAAQRWPKVTRTVGCIATDLKCEYKEPSSPITSVRLKAPKAAHHPAGQSSAVIRSVWQEWQLLDLLSGLFPLFSLPLFSHSCSVSLFHHELTTLTLQPLGCCQGANSLSALCYACICCLFIPSIFSKYNGGSLVVVLILLVCSHDRRGEGSMSQENIWMTWCQRSDRAEMELLLGG